MAERDWLSNPFRADIGDRLARLRAPLSVRPMNWQDGAWTQATVPGRPAPPALLQGPEVAVDVTDHGLVLLPLALDGRFYLRIDPGGLAVAFRVSPGRAQIVGERATITIEAPPAAAVVVVRFDAAPDQPLEPKLAWLPGSRRSEDDALWLSPADPGEVDPVVTHNNSRVPDPPRPDGLPPASFCVVTPGLAGSLEVADPPANGSICLADRVFPAAAVEVLRLGRWPGRNARALVIGVGPDDTGAERSAREWLDATSAERLELELPDAAITRQAAFAVHNSLAARARRGDGSEIFVHGRRDRGYGDVAHLHQSYQMHLPALAAGAVRSVRAELLTFAALQEDDGSLPRAPRPGVGSHPYVGRYTEAHLLLALRRYLVWTGDRELLDAPAGGLPVLTRAHRTARALLDHRQDGLLEPCGWLDAWPPDVVAQAQISLAGAMGLGALADVCRWVGDGEGAERYAAEAAALRGRVLDRCHSPATGLIAEHVAADGELRGGDPRDFWGHTQIWAALAGAAPDRRGLDAVREACLRRGVRVVPASIFESSYVASSTDGSEDLDVASTATWLLACWPELTHLYALAEIAAGRPELALDAVRAQLPERLHRANPVVAPHFYAEKYLQPGDEPWLCTWAGDPTLVEVLLCGFLGVQPTFEGLRLSPALPPGWYGARARFWWRGQRWSVTMDARSPAGSVLLDGRRVDPERPIPAGGSASERELVVGASVR